MIVPDPLRVGVIGASSTVARLAVLPALAASERLRLVAVASLSGRWPPEAGDARRHSSYQALLADDGVEAVYVPLPNGLHRAWTSLALQAGRHVLCEKPLAPSAAEAAAMQEEAASAQRVLVEAYMSPFHPRDEAIRALLGSGELGELRFARSAFTFPHEHPSDHRWRADMGGGALADLGVYCLSPLLATGQEPTALCAAAQMSGGGVDASFSGWFRLGGATAAFECSFEAPERQELELVGTEGALRVSEAFTAGAEQTGFELRRRDGTVERRWTGGADPYLRMLEHFADVVRGGARARHSLADSVALARLADRLRVAAGLAVPAAFLAGAR
ncbi:MAG: Gfo/Idh/MocA family protein [Acidimicrobiales bacterium]